jgi:Fic family protein
MARWEDAWWESTLGSGVRRKDQRSGAYRSYIPDLLDERAVSVDAQLSRRIAEAEAAVRRIDGAGGELLASVSRFLLRSEAIASSRIEGVAPSAKQVALAELGQTEQVRGISEQAQLVANNLTVVRDATTKLVDEAAVTVADIEALHRALLPDQPQLHGIRRVQNWIGGSDYHPLDADFVPPRPELVGDLMADLVGCIGGAAHSPLVQAALVHAQFETIHPFTDGNGRVGRALVHTVLARRGLTPIAVLPISLVFSTLRREYIEGLTAYRYDGPPEAPPAVAVVRRWVATFVEAAIAAAEQSHRIMDELQELRAGWADQVAEHRRAKGQRITPRSDSGTAKLLDLLPAAPVLTSNSVQRIVGLSPKAALDALAELQAAGILSRRSIGGGAHAYLADELLDLLTVAERRLASTKFDTRVSPPVRPVPALPVRPGEVAHATESPSAPQ